MLSEDVKPKKLSPFEIADRIFMKQPLSGDPVEAGYDTFMMNRICSNNRDCAFFAEAVNRYPGMSKHMSYTFYMTALDKGKRYGRWHKTEKNDAIGVIAKAYGVNRLRAAQYYRLLSPEGLASVAASQAQGGQGTTRKTRKK